MTKLFKNRIIELLKIVPKPPEDAIPTGISESEINDAERRIGINFPNELKEWLMISNGPCVGPGGIFGIKPQNSSLDIEKIISIYDCWKILRWIPMAGDGLGNYYVIDTAKKYKYGHPIYFIDTVEDIKKAEYVVASNIWSFIIFLLEKELGEYKWPFEKEYVIKNDPEIEDCVEVAKPWEVE